MVQHHPQLEAQSPDQLWSDLVVSMLSVNNHSLEKAYACIGGLLAEGLCAPENLSKWSVDELARRLIEAGCNRGSFMTQLYAKRLSALGAAVNDMGIEEFTRIVSTKNRSDISRLLMRINGIGPRVLQNFFLLRQI